MEVNSKAQLFDTLVEVKQNFKILTFLLLFINLIYVRYNSHFD